MRFIQMSAHNVLDYIYAVLIAASPWLSGFAKGGAETYVPAGAGAAVIVLSLFTDYRHSLKKTIAYNAHLTLELTIGVFLAVSPWLFGFYGDVYLPHLISGIFGVLLSVMSKKFVNYKPYN